MYLLITGTILMLTQVIDLNVDYMNALATLKPHKKICYYTYQSYKNAL